MPWWYLATLLAANLTLFLPPASVPRVAGALLLIGLLPGLSWARQFLAGSSFLFRWTTAAALSYCFTSLIVLLLYYLPGPVPAWAVIVTLNILAILPFLVSRKGTQSYTEFSQTRSTQRSLKNYSNLTHKILNLRSFAPLLIILLIALFLRTLNLDYSEFQGDEALAMIAAAEALEGHEDALFLRSKGPGEVLLPMALWSLTGAINEPVARLPFTAASLLAIVTIYLIGQRVANQQVGWLAAGFFAFNGFMVAFGRIVQYQVIVIWLCAEAFLLAITWHDSGQRRYILLSGLCLGLGLLAHYDAVLVVPAILWVVLTMQTADPLPALPLKGGGLGWRSFRRSAVSSLLFITATLAAALPFYLPFTLDPQANRTGDYLGGRIGNELRNNLPDFFHFNTFYSSSYYLIITGLLVLGLLAWVLWQSRWNRWLGIIGVIGILMVSFNPTLLTWNSINLSFLPFALLFLGPFLPLRFHKQLPQTPLDTPPPTSTRSVQPPTSNPFLPTPRFAPLLPLLLWLAIPFLGYNFIVALGLTHIYTIVPAWSLLAGLGWYCFFDSIPRQGSRGAEERRSRGDFPPAPLLPCLISNGFLSSLAILSTLFLWNAFIRHDVEYWQDYPSGNLPLYWNPYDQPPQAGFFGFAHRAGWKAVGQKIAAGKLVGDYGSNEEPDVTTWYTRGAPRACDPQPEFYFLAADLIDPAPVSSEIITAGYEQIGRVTLPNQKQMRIMQLKPVSLTSGEWDEAGLTRPFDQTATPPAFARSARGSTPIDANFSHLVRLIGYDLDTRRAYPGGRIPVTLYWQALTSIPLSYQVFTHLEGSSGPVAQADGVPACWGYPTDRWRPGQIIADPHAIYLSPKTPPGDYPLEVGLYQADTFIRLDVLDQAGNPSGGSVTLTRVKVIEKQVRRP